MREITVQSTVKAPLEKVWEFWNQPRHIKRWAFDSDEWEVSHAENDVRVDGKFKIVTTAKHQSSRVEYRGTYTEVKVNELIEYLTDDGRHVKVEFAELAKGVKITETFQPEEKYPAETQRAGWQATLDNFKAYAERNS